MYGVLALERMEKIIFIKALTGGDKATIMAFASFAGEEATQAEQQKVGKSREM